MGKQRQVGARDTKPRKVRESDRLVNERWNTIFARLIDPDYYTGVRIPSRSPISSFSNNAFGPQGGRSIC